MPSISRAQDQDPWTKHLGDATPTRRSQTSAGPWRQGALLTCGMPYWSMTCQMYQSSFRDIFLSRKVVTKAYSSGKPCGNTSLEGDEIDDARLRAEAAKGAQAPQGCHAGLPGLLEPAFSPASAALSFHQAPVQPSVGPSLSRCPALGPFKSSAHLLP